MSKSLELGSDDFDEKVIKSNKKVLVDFYAPWCSPCQQMEPVIDEAVSGSEKIQFFKVNIDDNSELAGKYNVMSLPTLLIFKEGKIIDQLIGVNSKESILEKIG